MVNIKVYIRQFSEVKTTGVVWIQFYVNREKVNFSTGVSCEMKNWNEKKSCINSSEKNADDKNLVIDKILARINDVFVKFRLRNKTITKDAFLRAYHRPDDYSTFFLWVKDYQRKAFVKTELSTVCVHRSVIRKLEAYNPSLHFDDITVEWLDVYYAYLRKELGNNENTAYKNMSTIRKYVRAAFKAGYMDENPFESWKIKRTRASYCYLEEEELRLLSSLYASGELECKYHKTLEFFLFLCYSSLHIGDAKPLVLEQFSEHSFTYFRVKLRNSKPEPIVVPISAPLRKLLNHIVGVRKKGPVFGKLPADQTMNAYLKKIAAIAGIDKPLSHKVGRHTFATLYLKKTKDITSLKEILGHSELRETLIYAHVLDESKQEGIRVFDDFEI